jgi:hypothetical protein
MSCESGGVKVDHACSVPNSGPIVTSFGFENRPLRAQQPRRWISSREMSEQRRASFAFSSLARPVHYWADALVFVETKRSRP